MSSSILIHSTSAVLIVLLLLAELAQARAQLSRKRSLLLKVTDLSYNLMVYLAFFSGLWLMLANPLPMLEQLQQDWLLGKLVLFVLIASFAAVPSALIFNQRPEPDEPSLAQMPNKHLLWLRLLIGSELLMFTAMFWLSVKA